MANTKEFNISSNAVTVLNQTAEATNNARKELKELQKQMLSMDADSAEFQKAAARAGELKDQMNDAADAIRTSTGPALESINNTFSIMSGQIANLDFGGLGQSLTSLGRAVDKINIKTLKDELGGLAKGFSNLAFSILSNPLLVFGAAVAALGYTFRKELISPITSTIKANEQLRESIKFTSEEIASAASEEIKQISKLEELKLAINDATSSTKERKEAVEELKKINPIYFKDLDSEKIKYADLNTQIDTYIKGLVAQSLAKAASVKIEQEAQKYLDEEIKRRQDLETATAKLAIAQAELADKSKAVEESGTNIFGGKSYGAGYERAKTTAAATGYSIQQIELEIKALNEAEFASKAAYEQRVKDLYNFKEAQQDIAESLGVTPPPPPKTKKEKKPAEVKREELGEVYDLELEYNLLLVDAEKSKQDALTATWMEGHKTRSVISDEYRKQLIEADRQVYEARWALASASVDLLGTIFQKNKKAADIAFALDKGLAIAKVVVDTQAEIAGYYAANAAAGPVGMAVASTQALAAKIRAATSIATIAAASVAKFASGGASSANLGGGGGTMGGTQAPSPANFDFLQNQPNQQPPLQAYVVSGQVSSNLEAQQLINNQARLGG